MRYVRVLPTPTFETDRESRYSVAPQTKREHFLFCC